MTQSVLQFDPMQTQAANLKRCKSKLAPFVIAFFQNRGIGAQFHGGDLSRYVSACSPCAPSSPDRIMRDLAEDGVLAYEVINRRQSLYEITKLPEVAMKEAA